ncbi:MAG: choice-of-anchor D domain-containing protein, partial [Candidatus Kapabacteria bacterium]|nr:choice-of-anchor D domain-containing protein [Candidatus Kapabacteria bacterium]
SEWVEVLVTKDNLDMRGFVVMDNNTDQEAWQGGVRFKNIDYWKNIRRGTVIGIWFRNYPNNSINNKDTAIGDGRIMLAQLDTNYFEFYKFLPSVRDDGPFNIALAGDILNVRDASGNSIHSLGHKTSPGASWTLLSPPKLNSATDVTNGWTNRVFPGDSLQKYNGAHGAPLTAFGSVPNGGDAARTYPNWGTNQTVTNFLFWHRMRRPEWSVPTLSAVTSASSVTLTWNAMTDPVQSDRTSGYLVLRDSGTTVAQPVDGKNYVAGDRIGNAVVVASFTSSFTTFTDNINIPCGVVYTYRVYPYRFGQDDELGATASPQTARGRQYNKESYAFRQAVKQAPPGPKLQAQGATSFCEGQKVTLSIPTQSGFLAQWQLNAVDIQGEGGFTIDARQTGEYRLKLIDQQGCIVFTDSVIVTVLPLPVSDVSPLNFNLCRDSILTLTATDNPDFTYQWFSDATPVSGATQRTYTTNAAGNFSVRVTNKNGCVNTSPIAVIKPIDPQITASLTTVDFNTLSVCQSSRDTVVTFTNTGALPIVFDRAIEPLGFAVVSPAFPYELKPNTKVDVRIRFQPTTPAPYVGTVEILGAPCGVNHKVTVSGVKPPGAGLGVQSLVTQVQYGIIIPCDADQFKLDSFALTSASNAQITNITVAAPFSLAPGQTVPFNISAGSTTYIKVLFTPLNDVAYSRDAVVNFTTQSCSDKLTVNLQGTKTTPNIEYSDDDITFATLDGCTKRTDIRTITIKNTGAVAVTIPQLTLPYLKILDATPVVIQPRDSVTLRIEFNPIGYTSVQRTFIRFPFTPCDNTAGIFVKGERLGATVQTTALDITVTPVALCQNYSDTMTIPITVTGNRAVTVSSITANTPYITTSLQRLQQLNPGAGTFNLFIGFDQSTPIGPGFDTLTVTLEPCSTVLRYPIRWTMNNVQFAVSPTFMRTFDTLDFGTLTLPIQTAPTRTISLRNTGRARITTSQLIGGIAAPFQFVSSSVPLGSVLNPNESVDVTFSYNPTVAGQSERQCTITVTEPCNDQAFITLKGRAQDSTQSVIKSPLTLWIDDTYTGSPGGRITIPVQISGTAVAGKQLDSLATHIIYNTSLLRPRSVTAGAALQGFATSFTQTPDGLRLLATDGQTIVSEGEAFQIVFDILLGDDTKTVIAVDSAQTRIGTASEVTLASVENGQFELTGVCNLSGRLLSVKGRVQLAVAAMNVSQQVEYVYETVSDDNTTIEVISSFGQRVLTLVDEPVSSGIHYAQFDTSGLPQGIYFLVMRSGISTRSVMFECVR